MNVIMVCATNKDRVIGVGNRLPWACSEDLRLFKEITSDQIVVMGRNTFESIGRPLPNRLNVVVTRSDLNKEGQFMWSPATPTAVLYINVKGITDVAAFLKARLQLLANKYKKDSIYIIGGSYIYDLFCDHLTHAYISYMDVTVPECKDVVRLTKKTWDKIDDLQSLKSNDYRLIQQVLHHDDNKSDPSFVHVKAKFEPEAEVILV